MTITFLLFIPITVFGYIKSYSIAVSYFMEEYNEKIYS